MLPDFCHKYYFQALAKVVDSWKGREAEKEDLINQLKEQHEQSSKDNAGLEKVRFHRECLCCQTSSRSMYQLVNHFDIGTY